MIVIADVTVMVVAAEAVKTVLTSIIGHVAIEAAACSVILAVVGPRDSHT